MRLTPIVYNISDIGHNTILKLECVDDFDDVWRISDGTLLMSKHFFFEPEPLEYELCKKFYEEFYFTFNEAIEKLEELERRNLKKFNE